MHPNYEKLAISLWDFLRGSRSNKVVGELLGTWPHRISKWNKGLSPIRTSTWLTLAKKNGLSLEEIGQGIVAPLVFPSFKGLVTPMIIQKKFMMSLFEMISKEWKLWEIASKLEVKNLSTINHWIKGDRDMPFVMFLKFINVISGRLNSFCEIIGFDQNLEEFGFSSQKPKFMKNFFKLPWTPTVYLAIQTKEYESFKIHSSSRLGEKLGLNREQVDRSLKILVDLELINFNGSIFNHKKGQFYASSALTEEMIENLNEFWFLRSNELRKKPGLHKIEEHALSYESKDKIMSWISELRDRIKLEVKKSHPETVVHIHWQLADLLS